MYADDDFFICDPEYDPEKPYEPDRDEWECIGEGCYRRKKKEPES